MEELNDLINKLKIVRDTLPQMTVEILNENETLITDLNIRQLQEGKRADGSFLPDYSPNSVRIYGKRPGPMTLEHTGAFYRGLYSKASVSSGLEMGGTDDKTEYLQRTYEENIISLSEDSEEYVKEEIVQPQLVDKLTTFLAP
jgi:hypothetical protein